MGPCLVSRPELQLFLHFATPALTRGLMKTVTPTKCSCAHTNIVRECHAGCQCVERTGYGKRPCRAGCNGTPCKLGTGAAVHSGVRGCAMQTGHERAGRGAGTQSGQAARMVACVSKVRLRGQHPEPGGSFSARPASGRCIALSDSGGREQTRGRCDGVCVGRRSQQHGRGATQL